MKKDFDLDRKNLITSVDRSSEIQTIKPGEDGNDEEPIFMEKPG